MILYDLLNIRPLLLKNFFQILCIYSCYVETIDMFDYAVSYTFFVYVSSFIYTNAVSHLINSVMDIAVAITLLCTVIETYIAGGFSFSTNTSLSVLLMHAVDGFPDLVLSFTCSCRQLLLLLKFCKLLASQHLESEVKLKCFLKN